MNCLHGRLADRPDAPRPAACRRGQRALEQAMRRPLAAPAGRFSGACASAASATPSGAGGAHEIRRCARAAAPRRCRTRSSGSADVQPLHGGIAVDRRSASPPHRHLADLRAAGEHRSARRAIPRRRRARAQPPVVRPQDRFLTSSSAPARAPRRSLIPQARRSDGFRPSARVRATGASARRMERHRRCRHRRDAHSGRQNRAIASRTAAASAAASQAAAVLA